MGGGGFGGGGGGFSPRPGGPGGGFGGPGGGGGGRDRSANFGPPAPPKRLRGAKKSSQQEHKPRGPIKEKNTGRTYALDDLEDDAALDIDNLATKAPEDPGGIPELDDEVSGQDDETDDQD
jgi:hypothetical protein